MILLYLFIIYYGIRESYIEYCRTKKIFNHITIFSSGFFLYMILPLLIGHFNIYRSQKSMEYFYRYYTKISEINIFVYLLFCLSIMYAFFKGTKNGIFKSAQKKVIKKQFHLSLNKMRIINIVLIIISVYYIWIYRNAFFKGYLIEEDINRGMFAGLVSMTLPLMIMYSIELKNRGRKMPFLNPPMFLYAILSVLLLSLGTRMYFISTVISIFVLVNKMYNIKIRNIMIIGVIVIGIIGVIGVARSAYGTFDLYYITHYLMLEFLYTSLSMIHFLAYSTFRFVQLPILLLSYVINLIPTIIFPSKLNYVLTPLNIGFYVYNPGGAINLFTELMMNFGLFGSPIAFYFFGKWLGKISSDDKDTLFMTIYVMISGFIGFSFFRDGFVGGLVKNIFEFSFIVPCIYYIYAKFSFNEIKEKVFSIFKRKISKGARV